eukprot:TRINITY_DN40690_c0_g1_i1.p1 TRINITY_DN40690_c0_g1~~TRINITY_DN40690_c0_g1_i1.p1  ORF type:complete len:1339 (+),score=175.44 TRINITY_DN40690_c0_g1_i1:64-4080(+)
MSADPDAFGASSRFPNSELWRSRLPVALLRGVALLGPQGALGGEASDDGSDGANGLELGNQQVVLLANILGPGCGPPSWLAPVLFPGGLPVLSTSVTSESNDGHHIPVHPPPSRRFSTVVTDNNVSRIYVAALVVYVRIGRDCTHDTSTDDEKTDDVWMPLVIGAWSFLPEILSPTFVDTLVAFCESAGLTDCSSMTNDSMVAACARFAQLCGWLVFEVPAPPCGCSIVLHWDSCLSHGSKRRTMLCVGRSPPGGFPHSHVPLQSVITCLDVRATLLVVKLLLLEHKVVFVSSSANRLVSVCEAFATILLYPVVWRHSYNPLVLDSDYLNLPWPFLFGLLRPVLDTGHDGMPDVAGWLETSTLEVSDPREFTIIDLDMGDVLPCPGTDDLPSLPEALESSLRFGLTSIRVWGDAVLDLGDDDNDSDDTAAFPCCPADSQWTGTRTALPPLHVIDENFNLVVQHLFHCFTSSLLEHVASFAQNDIFPKDDFVAFHEEQAQPFYRSFVLTSAFVDYLRLRALYNPAQTPCEGCLVARRGAKEAAGTGAHGATGGRVAVSTHVPSNVDGESWRRMISMAHASVEDDDVKTSPFDEPEPNLPPPSGFAIQWRNAVKEKEDSAEPEQLDTATVVDGTHCEAFSASTVAAAALAVCGRSVNRVDTTKVVDMDSVQIHLLFRDVRDAEGQSSPLDLRAVSTTSRLLGSYSASASAPHEVDVKDRSDSDTSARNIFQALSNAISLEARRRATAHARVAVRVWARELLADISRSATSRDWNPRSVSATVCACLAEKAGARAVDLVRIYFEGCHRPALMPITRLMALLMKSCSIKLNEVLNGLSRDSVAQIFGKKIVGLLNLIPAECLSARDCQDRQTRPLRENAPQGSALSDADLAKTGSSLAVFVAGSNSQRRDPRESKGSNSSCQDDDPWGVVILPFGGSADDGVLNNARLCKQSTRPPVLLSIEILRAAIAVTVDAHQGRWSRCGSFVTRESTSVIDEAGGSSPLRQGIEKATWAVHALPESLNNLLSELQVESLHSSLRALNSEGRLCFWLNCLNAGILIALLCMPEDRGPLDGFISWSNFLRDAKLHVFGKVFSLFEIEHVLLRVFECPPQISRSNATAQWQKLFQCVKASAGSQKEALCRQVGLTSMVPNVSFGVHYPIRSRMPALRIYHPEVVRAQLILNCAHLLMANLHIDVQRKTVEVPGIVRWYAAELGGSSPCEILNFVHQALSSVPWAIEQIRAFASSLSRPAETSGMGLGVADAALDTKEAIALVEMMQHQMYAGPCVRGFVGSVGVRVAFSEPLNWEPSVEGIVSPVFFRELDALLMAKEIDAKPDESKAVAC